MIGREVGQKQKATVSTSSLQRNVEDALKAVDHSGTERKRTNDQMTALHNQEGFRSGNGELGEFKFCLLVPNMWLTED
jgi:hypothetical protein